MPAEPFTADAVKAMLLRVCAEVMAAESELTEADRRIGDGDHGLGMQRGMTAARLALESAEVSDVAAAFGAMGLALMSSMGGASGAIYGTLFRAGAKALAGLNRFDAAALSTFLAAGLAGVCQRGGAIPGDKTLVDALQPAAAAAAALADQPLSVALHAAAAAAREGAEATRDMLARHGRARSLGKGALGHPDPGALSLVILLGAMDGFVGSWSLRGSASATATPSPPAR